MNKLLGILVGLVAWSFISSQVECLECHSGSFYTSSKTPGEFVGTKPSSMTCNSTQTYCYKIFDGLLYYHDSDYYGGVVYTGGCAINCVAGKATSGNSVKGVACCTTNLCNSSSNLYVSKLVIACVLLFIISSLKID